MSQLDWIKGYSEEWESESNNPTQALNSEY